MAGTSSVERGLAGQRLTDDQLVDLGYALVGEDGLQVLACRRIGYSSVTPAAPGMVRHSRAIVPEQET